MLFWGSLKFSTISILYLNAPFILLSLLPLRVRETKGYQRMLFWLYMISNSIGIVILNLADVIYYRYAFKRITLEEMHFFEENDNTFDILFQSMGDNWYVVLLAALLIFFLVFVYKKIKYHPTEIANPVAYYVTNTLVLAVSFLLWVAGVRGSTEWKARPGDVIYRA